MSSTTTKESLGSSPKPIALEIWNIYERPTVLQEIEKIKHLKEIDYQDSIKIQNCSDAEFRKQCEAIGVDVSMLQTLNTPDGVIVLSIESKSISRFYYNLCQSVVIELQKKPSSYPLPHYDQEGDKYGEEGNQRDFASDGKVMIGKDHHVYLYCEVGFKNSNEHSMLAMIDEDFSRYHTLYQNGMSKDETTKEFDMLLLVKVYSKDGRGDTCFHFFLLEFDNEAVKLIQNFLVPIGEWDINGMIQQSNLAEDELRTGYEKPNVNIHAKLKVVNHDELCNYVLKFGNDINVRIWPSLCIFYEGHDSNEVLGKFLQGIQAEKRKYICSGSRIGKAT